VAGGELSAAAPEFVGQRLAALTRQAASGATLTPRQAAAVGRRPGLFRAFLGERVDTAAKAAIANDRALQPLIDAGRLRVTGRFRFGPDVFLTDSNGTCTFWWDITTEGAWQAHVMRYSATHGTGYAPLFY